MEKSSKIDQLLSSTNLIPTKIISCDILSHEKVLKMNIDHQMIEDYIDKNGFKSLYAVSTKGKKYYSNCNFFKNDSFIFGPETRGLPKKILDKFETEKILKIPMLENNRSLNLSNATSIIIYEAWRQINFKWNNKMVINYSNSLQNIL